MKWADEAEQELHEFYTSALLLKSNPPSARKIHLTQASKGHAARARASSNDEHDSKEMFKLTKFKNVPKRLHTFRDDQKQFDGEEEEELARNGTDARKPVTRVRR